MIEENKMKNKEKVQRTRTVLGRGTIIKSVASENTAVCRNDVLN